MLRRRSLIKVPESSFCGDADRRLLLARGAAQPFLAARPVLRARSVARAGSVVRVPILRSCHLLRVVEVALMCVGQDLVVLHLLVALQHLLVGRGALRALDPQVRSVHVVVVRALLVSQLLEEVQVGLNALILASVLLWLAPVLAAASVLGPPVATVSPLVAAGPGLPLALLPILALSVSVRPLVGSVGRVVKASEDV